jgi:tRNA1(Val) A37 N6-methylase TrmN6
MDELMQKRHGAYYSPNAVVQSLVRWAVRRETDRLIDPSCGDGRFLLPHPLSVGVEQDPEAARIVHSRVPGSLIHQGDFFSWAQKTKERFDCAAGNPPFIRYQRFSGQVRQAALDVCSAQGAKLSSLSSSWAPFIVATGALLKPGGRMAFVVPAEIGHAPYARPVLEYLTSHFGLVQIVAVRRKLFPELSENCWLLFADGFGARSNRIELSILDQFVFSAAPPPVTVCVSLEELSRWNFRIRPFLLNGQVLDLYRRKLENGGTYRLGDAAKVGIGYVSGDNDFFHLRPSEANLWRIPRPLLQPTVRNGRRLAGKSITASVVQGWIRDDDSVLLLRLRRQEPLPDPVLRYIDSAGGEKARGAYKCRNREPWYVVPDVTIPDGFLSYMSSHSPNLVENCAGCAGTNSVHMVRLTGKVSFQDLQKAWAKPLTVLSCELEGHPLGGGLLKMEPREAARVAIAGGERNTSGECTLIEEGIETMRRWRDHE